MGDDEAAGLRIDYGFVLEGFVAGWFLALEHRREIAGNMQANISPPPIPMLA